MGFHQGVHTEEYLPGSRTHAREGQCGSGSGIEIDEIPLQSDAESTNLHPDKSIDGPLNLFTFRWMKQVWRFYS